MKKRKICSCILTLILILTCIPISSNGAVTPESLEKADTSISASENNASLYAAEKIKTKQYTITKTAGTYSFQIKIKLKAKKGYKIYYSLNGKFKKKNMIKSKKKKVITISSTTTLQVYAVKSSKKITAKILKKKAVKKAKKYTYEPQVNAIIPSDALLFNGHHYRLYNENIMDWEEAKDFCEQQGGHLVTISSEKEQSFLKNICTGEKNLYWIGLQKINDNWRWVTGEKVSYTNWAPGEPNEDFNDTEYYVQMYGEDYEDNRIGEWNDSRNDSGTVSFYHLENVGFICEWDE